MTIELAKMLALVAPSTMTADQQEMWLRAAADALDGIRVDEVRGVSAEVRRKVTRHNQIVPEIAKFVAERRERNAQARETAARPPLPPPAERQPAPPLTEAEIKRMPKWLKDIGFRVGFLGNRNGRIVDTAASRSD